MINKVVGRSRGEGPWQFLKLMAATDDEFLGTYLVTVVENFVNSKKRVLITAIWNIQLNLMYQIIFFYYEVFGHNAWCLVNVTIE